MKLARHYVEKPWGRTELPAAFDAPAGKRIGEVWFEGPADLPLLAKYIFTSERLSIQVHPDDDQARARGLQQGKSECWLIVDAEPGAVLGLGLKREVSRDELRAAALDGSIEDLMDWRPVSAGDFVYVPAGTIHAIGAGISLLEFQQNSDVTYRLYDYGRPRELHLDEGLEVATAGTFADEFVSRTYPGQRTGFFGPHFAVDVANEAKFQHWRRWVLPLEGSVRAGGETAAFGECLIVEADDPLESDDGRFLIGVSTPRS